MIWLKENTNFLGYVPILKKEYKEENIRELSQYSCYQGFSKLSKLVMQIQGIGFEYYGGFSNHYKVEAKRLIDINFDFEFECFLLPDDPRMETYRNQIFEVFENLTLHKVEEYSEEELKQKITQVKQTLEQLVSTKTLSAIEYDVSRLTHLAKKSSTNLCHLQKMFADKGYPLTNNLLSNIDDSISQEIYAERETKTILKMSCY